MSDREQIIEEMRKNGYVAVTGIENVADNVLASFDAGERSKGDVFVIEDCLEWVDATGGWPEFDYY